MIAFPAKCIANKHSMFWAAVILSVSSSGATPALDRDSLCPDFTAPQESVASASCLEGQSSNRAWLAQLSDQDSTQTANRPVSRKTVSAATGKIGPDPSIADVPPIADRSNSVAGRATNYLVQFVSSSEIVKFFPGNPGRRGVEPLQEVLHSPGKSVDRQPDSKILAWNPQIERLCRYVEEQSRRGPAAVGHEKTHPRSERPGDLPQARDPYQLRKGRPSPFFREESIRRAWRLRSIYGFGAVYPVREALPVYGKTRRTEPGKATPGNRVAKAGSRHQEASVGFHKEIFKEVASVRISQKESSQRPSEKGRDLLILPVSQLLYLHEAAVSVQEFPQHCPVGRKQWAVAANLLVSGGPLLYLNQKIRV